MIRVIARHNINFNRDEVLAILVHLIGSRTVTGDHIRHFEEEFAAYHGVRFGVALSSGRAALYTILKALDLPEGAEIIVPSYSFFTIPKVVEACGFTPVFAANDPTTYAIDPDRLEKAFSRQTGAVIVIHPFGQMAEMERILLIAKKRGVPVIEDASQSIGATLNGRKAGSFGLASTISLVHGKNLTTLKGGMAITDDEEMHRRILRHSQAATTQKSTNVRLNALSSLANWFFTTRPGYILGPYLPFYLLSIVNRKRLDALFDEEPVPFLPHTMSRLSNLQAALGRLQLTMVDQRNQRRRSNALDIMAGLNGLKDLELPVVVGGCEGTWNALPIRVKDASTMQRGLMMHGVDSRSDYMTIYAYEEDWKRFGEVLYLPSHPAMNEADVHYVIITVRRILES